MSFQSSHAAIICITKRAFTIKSLSLPRITKSLIFTHLIKFSFRQIHLVLRWRNFFIEEILPDLSWNFSLWCDFIFYGLIIGILKGLYIRSMAIEWCMMLTLIYLVWIRSGWWAKKRKKVKSDVKLKLEVKPVFIRKIFQPKLK